MDSLKDHAVPIISTLFFLVTGLVGLVWKGNSDKLNSLSIRLKTIEDKIDKFFELHYECQRQLPLVFVTKEELVKKETIEYADRKERWDKLDATLARIEARLENHITSHKH